jgi:selenium metabolism protein YedF
MQPTTNGRVMLIKHDAIGQGELGVKLMAGFMAALVDQPVLPEKIFFINRGVFCTTTQGPVLDSLIALENKGVQIFSCGTCLDYFDLADKLKAGQRGSAPDTLSALIEADNTLTL